MKIIYRFVLTMVLWFALLGVAHAQDQKHSDYLLGPGDVVRITVFQNPDLTTEGRVSESGGITFPLLGTVQIGGLTQQAAEKKLAQLLKDGGFVVQAQVNLLVVQVRGNQVAVLGQVNRPGRYPLETFNTRLVDMLANAGGISAGGADVAIITGLREGKAFRREIDVANMYLRGDFSENIVLSSGDSIYVHRAPVFYIYGEVQRPGAFRVERGMTLMQALATGGGITQRGTLKGIKITRREVTGGIQTFDPLMDTPLKADDVIYIKESLF